MSGTVVKSEIGREFLLLFLAGAVVLLVYFFSLMLDSTEEKTIDTYYEQKIIEADE